MADRPRPAPAASLTYALVYGRVSSAEQAREGVSLDVQLAECRRYAAALGWVLAAERVDVLSGTRDDRPQYRALLTDCRERRAADQAVAVVVLRLDRLGRRLTERVRAFEALRALGVPIHSVREGGIVSELVANILASVAQEEVRLLGERVSDAKQHIARGGWWAGGRPPWGYRLRPATPTERADGAPLGVLEVDPTAAPFAAEALARFVAGASVHAVVRWLAQLPPAARQGRQLAYARVREWLTAEAPRGQSHGQPARWPALIGPDAAAAVDARVRGWAGGRRQPSGRYLLTGLLRCPRCGAPMVGHAHASPRQARYRCNSWQASRAPRGPCRASATAVLLDALVLDAVDAMLAPLLTQDRALQRSLARAWARQAQTMPDAPVAAQHAALARAQAQAERRLRDAATLYVDGALDRAGYEAVRTEAEAALGTAARALAALAVPAPVRLPAWAAVRALLGAWSRAAQEERRLVLLELLTRVVPRRQGHARWRVDLTWTPLGTRLQELAVLSDEPG